MNNYSLYKSWILLANPIKKASFVGRVATAKE